MAKPVPLSKVNLFGMFAESEIESVISSLHRRRTSLRANRGCQLRFQTVGS